MKSKQTYVTATLFSGLAVILMAMISIQPPKSKPWIIPEKYKIMTNPVKSTTATVTAGEGIYRKNCASCHGRTGLGDGPKAKTLDTFPGDFSKGDFQSLSDGTVFYQSKFGRGDMPKYENKIEDTDIWSIVNYIRTLK